VTGSYGNAFFPNRARRFIQESMNGAPSKEDVGVALMAKKVIGRRPLHDGCFTNSIGLTRRSMRWVKTHPVIASRWVF